MLVTQKTAKIAVATRAPVFPARVRQLMIMPALSTPMKMDSIACNANGGREGSLDYVLIPVAMVAWVLFERESLTPNAQGVRRTSRGFESTVHYLGITQGALHSTAGL